MYHQNNYGIKLSIAPSSPAHFFYHNDTTKSKQPTNLKYKLN